MDIALTAVHYMYILGIVTIVGFMVCKKDTSMVCILAIFGVGMAATGSLYGSIGGVFNSFIVAINELAGTILIISVVTALCKLLDVTGINERMVSPITKLIKNPTSAYWIIGTVMFIVSIFFWPSPAVAVFIYTQLISKNKIEFIRLKLSHSSLSMQSYQVNSQYNQ